jgi:hypothetical protein
MLGLTAGELLVVGFVTVVVVSAPWWPRAGAAIAELLGGSDANRQHDPPVDRAGNVDK